MNAPHATPIVEGYFARLEMALAGVEPARQRELVDDLRGHVAEARAALTEETDEDLFAILERLGDPAELARDVDGPAPLAPATSVTRSGLLELAAVVLALVVWPAGMILAWLSRVWSDREKVVATLIGAVAFVVGFPVFAPLVGPVLGPFVGSLGAAAPAFMGAIGALPLASAVYLAVRLRRHGPPVTAATWT